MDEAHRAALDRDGYTILRKALPKASLAPLRERFERLDTPSHAWPAPREFHTRHAMLDGDETVLRACATPVLLAAVRHILRHDFDLRSVEGRDPKPGGGRQTLHRDWLFGTDRPMRLAKALAFLDDYGPSNGATRVIPGSHVEPCDYSDDDPRQTVIEGQAGDVFVFHGRLAHSGTRNASGAKRRALQMWFEADV